MHTHMYKHVQIYTHTHHPSIYPSIHMLSSLQWQFEWVVQIKKSRCMRSATAEVLVVVESLLSKRLCTKDTYSHFWKCVFPISMVCQTCLVHCYKGPPWLLHVICSAKISVRVDLQWLQCTPSVPCCSKSGLSQTSADIHGKQPTLSCIPESLLSQQFFFKTEHLGNWGVNSKDIYGSVHTQKLNKLLIQQNINIITCKMK